MTAPQGRERTPGVIEEAITEMSLRRYTPIQIQRELPPIVQKLGLKMPSLRTIQRIHRRNQPDDSGPWAVEDSSPADARIILDLMAEAILDHPVPPPVGVRLDGLVIEKMTRPWVTKREAKWLLLLQRVGPPVPFWVMLRMARFYMEQRDQGQDTSHIERFLAFAPWQNTQRLEAYLEILQEGGLGSYTEVLSATLQFLQIPSMLILNNRMKTFIYAPLNLYTQPLYWAGVRVKALFNDETLKRKEEEKQNVQAMVEALVRRRLVEAQRDKEITFVQLENYLALNPEGDGEEDAGK